MHPLVAGLFVFAMRVADMSLDTLRLLFMMRGRKVLAGLIGATLARQIVKTWLETEFGGGRHARRVDKIVAIEKRFSK